MDQKRILIAGDNTLSQEEVNTVLSVKDNIVIDLADKETTKLIADKLGVSNTTIQSYRKNLLNKSHAKSIGEVVKITSQNNCMDIAA